LPTHDETDQFRRDWDRPSPDEKRQFRGAVKKFVEDLGRLPPGQFRKGLRVKPMQGADGIFEMTWEISDGRATFQYGPELSGGDPHIIWRRIGGHAIFGNP
jgi:hypothetical protein